MPGCAYLTQINKSPNQQSNVNKKMPLLLSAHPLPDAAFGLWQIAEREDFFRADLPLSAAEEAELAQHRIPLRRLEWLAGRWLLHRLTGAPQRLPLAKDAFSKPFFPENQQLACSLSHSQGTVGALVFEQKPSNLASKNGQLTTDNPNPSSIGCDIQRLTHKMPRIAPKFLSASEKWWLESRPEAEQFDLLHLFWTAKESLYKAYGLKELDFRKHIFVENVAWDGQNGHAKGRIEKGNFEQAFRLLFQKIGLPDGGELLWAIAQSKP
jgi:4'-phosphopantetheinyl transferase